MTQRNSTIHRSKRVFAAVASATLLSLSVNGIPAALAKEPTPADIARCEAETAAYNAAWANTWAAANNKPASQAPPPPVPYKCGPVPDDPAPVEVPDKPDAPAINIPQLPDRDSGTRPSIEPGRPGGGISAESGSPSSPLSNRGDAPQTIAPGASEEPIGSIAPFESLLLDGQTLGELLEEARLVAEKVTRSLVPEFLFRNLGTRDKHLYLNYTTPEEIFLINKFSVQKANYCRNDGDKYGRKSKAGNTLYTFWQTVEICSSAPGIRLSSVRIVDSGGETSTPSWSYDGTTVGPLAYPLSNGIWISKNGENFNQKIVVSGIGAGTKTECITGVSYPSGEYSSENSCG